MYSVKKFKEDKDEWYQRSLRTGRIDSWNFNAFLQPKKIPVFAILTKNLEKWKKRGYVVLSKGKEFSLITESKRKIIHDKKFNGEVYMLYKIHPTKTEAQKYAESMRKVGYKARIVPMIVRGKAVHGVYLRGTFVKD